MDSSFENAILVLSKFKKEMSAANEKPLIRFSGSIGEVSFSVDGVINELSKQSIRVRGSGFQLSLNLARARFLNIVYFEPREVPEELRSEGFVSYWQFNLANDGFFIVAEFPAS